MLPMKVPGDDKPASGFSFWRWSDAIRWLGDELPAGSDLTRWLEPEIEERVHIAVDPKTGASAEGMLFSTRMVAFESYRRDGGAGPALYSYLCRVDGVDDVRSVTGAGLLGGESRVAVVETEPPDSWPTCPTPLARMLAGARHVRMALATPAIFTYGWHPGWLDQKTKTGSPPGLPDVTLRLVAAAVPRRQAVSGWDLMQGGPKPIRYCVPAGAVYFFEVVGGDPAALAQAGWLASVSDAEETRMPGDTRSNNRDDGYGLALWGVWKGKE
jgi:CRISPR-associated protein Cmr3